MKNLKSLKNVCVIIPVFKARKKLNLVVKKLLNLKPQLIILVDDFCPEKSLNTITNNLIGYSLIFLTGFLNGSLSAGTGLIFTIILISWYGMDYKKAIAYTLIIVGIFFNALGAITLGLVTEIEWMLLPALFFGSLTGGYLGAKISLSKSNRTIKIIYQTITIIVGVSLIM